MRVLIAILLCAAALPAQKQLSEQEVRASMEGKQRELNHFWDGPAWRTPYQPDLPED